MRTAISHHAFQQRKVGQYWHFTAWVWNVSKQADPFVSRRSTESERASAIANFTSQHGTVKTWPWKSNSFHSLSKFLFCFWAFQVWPKDLIERERDILLEPLTLSHIFWVNPNVCTGFGDFFTCGTIIQFSGL